MLKLQPLILTSSTMPLYMVSDIENVTSNILIVWPDNEWDFVPNITYITNYYFCITLGTDH